jgi:hypothetical protein
MKEILIGNRGADHLALDVDDRHSLGFNVIAYVQVGSFRGTVRTWTFGGVFRRFAENLRKLERTLEGEIVFVLEEDALEVKFTGDGKGHVATEGKLKSNTMVPDASLKFAFVIDQTYLGPAIRQIDEVEPADKA